MTPYPEFIVRRNRIQDLAIQGPFTVTSKNYGQDLFSAPSIYGAQSRDNILQVSAGSSTFFSLKITGRIPFQPVGFIGQVLFPMQNDGAENFFS